MSNAQLMMSLAGIAGGFGKAPAKAPTGVAKERLHLKNLQPWERDAAKAEYQVIVDKAKADRAAAIAAWLNRYPAAMPVEYRKIDKVVARFLVGQPADAAASGVSTDGGSLVVQGREVANRRNANDRFITVCPGLFGEGKAARYTANSTLRHVGAGIRVSDIMRGKGDEGFAFFSPTRSPRQGRIVIPDACLRVEVTNEMRRKAMEAAYGSDVVGPMQQESRASQTDERGGVLETRKAYRARVKKKPKYRKMIRTPSGSKKDSKAQAKLLADLKAKRAKLKKAAAAAAKAAKKAGKKKP